MFPSPAGQTVHTVVTLKLPHVSGAQIEFSLFTPHNLGKSHQVTTQSQVTTPPVAQEPPGQEKPEKSPLPELSKLDPPTIEEAAENFG